MTPEQIDIAKRLVALPSWEWRVGMLAKDDSGDVLDGSIRLYHPVTIIEGERGPMGIHHGGNRCPISMHGPYIPNLTDAATGGVLLGMLPREALIEVYRQRSDPEWQVEVAGRIFYGPTLGHACALALLAVHS